MSSSTSPISPVHGTASVDPLERIVSDAADLETFFTLQLRRLRRWAHGRLQRRLRGGDDTSDVVQDVLLRTIGRLDLLRPRTHRALAAYLRTAVRHRLIDVHRRESRWQVVELDDRLHASDASPFQRAVDADTWRRYRAALETLSSRDRELVVGHLELDYSHAQLGCMIGRSPNAARMALARAMARLAERMAP